jgi:hypothetical protein
MIVAMSDSMTVVEQRFAYTDPLEAIQAISGCFVSTKVRSYGLSPSFTCHGASWRVGDLMMTEMVQHLFVLQIRKGIAVTVIDPAPGQTAVFAAGAKKVLPAENRVDLMRYPRTE